MSWDRAGGCLSRTFGEEFNILPGTDKIRHSYDYDESYDLFIS